MSAALWQVWAWADAPSSSSHSHRPGRAAPCGARSVGSGAIPKGKASAGILRAVKAEGSLNACKGYTCAMGSLVINAQEIRPSGVHSGGKISEGRVAAEPRAARRNGEILMPRTRRWIALGFLLVTPALLAQTRPRSPRRRRRLPPRPPQPPPRHRLHPRLRHRLQPRPRSTSPIKPRPSRSHSCSRRCRAVR